MQGGIPNARSWELDYFFLALSTTAQMSVDQLNGAKAVVRENPALYPEIVKGILNIADRPETDLRRWCAAFLVDAFASPDLSEEVKQTLAIDSLNTLLTLVNDRDFVVLRHSITCIGIVYPLLFSYVCPRPMEGALWDNLVEVKRRALAQWTSQQRHLGVLVACIKFSQVVVQVQSRQPPTSRDDVSLALVPRGHPLIDPVELAAESAGLLDRLLSYFVEPDLDVVYFQASFNSVLSLVQSRSSLGPKIVPAVLAFDPTRKRLSCSKEAVDLAHRFVYKTLQLELGALAHHNLVPQFTPVIQKYLAKINEGRANASLRKRAAEVEDSPSAKRVRLSDSDMPVVTTTRLPSGEVPLSELYSLVDAENALAKFNARDLQLEVAIEIAMSSLGKANQTLLDNCLAVVGKRYDGIPEAGRVVKRPTDTPPEATPEPIAPEPEAEAEFSITNPQKMTPEIVSVRSTELVDRLVNAAAGAPDEERAEGVAALRKSVLEKWTSHAWVIVASRAASRGAPADSAVSSAVRDYLYNYVISDFRDRLETMVWWLSEEWYAEWVLAEAPPAGPEKSIYYQQVGRIVDQLLPRAEVSDSKVLIRFFSELPALSREIVFKLRSVCQDPERSLLGFRTLKFLIMFKPPIKEDCLDLVQELYDAGADGAEAILKRYRPEALKAAAPEAAPAAV